MNFAQRLVLGFVLLAVVAAAAGYFGLRAERTHVDGFDAVADETLPVLTAVSDVERATFRLLASANELAVIRLTSAEDTEEIEVELDLIAESESELDRSVERYSELVNLFFPDEVQLSEILSAQAAVFKADASAFVAAATTGDVSDIGEQKERLEGSEALLLATLREVRAAEAAELADRREALEDTEGMQLRLALGSAVVLVVLAIALGARLVRDYNRLETNRREATQELQDANAQLERERLRKAKFEVLGQVTATVSHELRNPLGTIKTSLFSMGEELRRSGAAGVVDVQLERMDRSVSRCETIVADLLDYTRASAVALEREPVDPWLSEALDEVTVPDGVVVHRAFGAGAEIDMDPERLRRAIVNVIENAIHALSKDGQSLDTHSVGGNIDVRTEVVAGDVVISVADNGSGIPDELLGQVFEPLYSTKTRGVGMGLPTVRQIIEQHGGTIDLENRPGGGVNVVIVIPTSKAGAMRP